MNLHPIPTIPLPLNRRRWMTLVTLGACGVGSARAQQDVPLPAPRSLPDALKAALAKKEPLIVMASLPGCPFCKVARQNYLQPMRAEGAIQIVQIDFGNASPLIAFSGEQLTQAQQIRQWSISIAPTLLFFGPGGTEVAERMTGGYLPDFYAAYLDQRLEKARKLIASSAS